MQINNFQRLAENIKIEDGDAVKRIKELAAKLETSQDEKTITELMVMLSKIASKSGIELEAALYKRLDELRKA
ncbi:MAG: hypothetical protein V1836_01145 [Candidatus Aenigmatarchaeota archaeon]